MKKILFCFFFLCNFAYASSFEEAFKSIPFKERVDMGHFFRLMIEQDQLAHVLFFDTKPAALAGFSKNHHRNFQDKLFSKGWKTWKKWEPLFPHPNFIFCEDDAGFESWSVVHLFVINKSTLKKCLQKNKDLFQNILGTAFSPDNFVVSLEKNKQLYPLINHNEVLLGIILGFGRESSIAYQHASDGDDLETLAKADIMRYRLFPVCFRGNPKSEEVATLLQKYREEGRKYLCLSRNKNSLKLSLEALTSN